MSLDHLVIACETLGQGVQWCEECLGVTPAAGGTHPKDGTHNRLLSLSGKYPQAYLEIIALNSEAEPDRKPNFDLTDPKIKARTQVSPVLVAWVARPAAEIHETAKRLCAMNPMVDVGDVLDAERGTLKWKLTWRSDGRRLFGGVFPRLIQWPSSTPHPASTLPRSDVSLVDIRATYPDKHVAAALDCAGLREILPVDEGPVNLTVTLRTPKGMVNLQCAVGDLCL